MKKKIFNRQMDKNDKMDLPLFFSMFALPIDIQILKEKWEKEKAITIFQKLQTDFLLDYHMRNNKQYGKTFKILW